MQVPVVVVVVAAKMVVPNVVVNLIATVAPVLREYHIESSIMSLLLTHYLVIPKRRKSKVGVILRPLKLKRK